MFRTTVAVSAFAALLSLGTAGAAAASTPAEDPPAPQQQQPQAAPMVPVFYFGTQTYCMTAAALGQQMGVLTAGHWKCDSGWLMATPPIPTQFP